SAIPPAKPARERRQSIAWAGYHVKARAGGERQQIGRSTSDLWLFSNLLFLIYPIKYTSDDLIAWRRFSSFVRPATRLPYFTISERGWSPTCSAGTTGS